MFSIVDSLSELSQLKTLYLNQLTTAKLLYVSSLHSECNEAKVEIKISPTFYEYQTLVLSHIIQLITQFCNESDVITNTISYIDQLTNIIDFIGYKKQKLSEDLNQKIQNAIILSEEICDTTLRDKLIEYKAKAYKPV